MFNQNSSTHYADIFNNLYIVVVEIKSTINSTATKPTATKLNMLHWCDTGLQMLYFRLVIICRLCLCAGPLSALYKDVNVVHPSLLSCVDPLESQQVRELLRKLGVHELEPQELLEQHIYPSIQNNKWKVQQHTVYIHCIQCVSICVKINTKTMSCTFELK